MSSLMLLVFSGGVQGVDMDSDTSSIIPGKVLIWETLLGHPPPMYQNLQITDPPEMRREKFRKNPCMVSPRRRQRC